MWRLLWGMILGALILVALSESVRQDLAPYLERGAKLAANLVSRVREAGGVQEPEANREAEPSDQTGIVREPSSSLADHPGRAGEGREGGPDPAAKDTPGGRDIALRQEPKMTRQETKEPGAPEFFPDMYERSRTSLLQAREILEGTGDARN